MAFYIQSTDGRGKFVGEFMGLGFFEIDRGQDVSLEEKPIAFTSRKEAQDFLDSWSGGPDGCVVVEGP